MDTYHCWYSYNELRFETSEMATTRMLDMASLVR
jgi:hypothetical protein